MFNLNAFGIFKKSDVPEPAAEPDAPAPAPAPAGFFQGISPAKLLDTVSSKKNGLLDDLSSKFDQISKLVAKEPAGEQLQKQAKKVRKSKPKADDDDDSSASEYGDDGDLPVYEGVAAECKSSLATAASTESLDEYSKQVKAKVSDFVSHVVDPRYDIPPAEMQQFFECAKDSVGQQAFCTELQRSNQAHVTDTVFQRLVQCFAYVLKQSHEAEDYLSARLLMNICFTIYSQPEEKGKVYLYEAVRSQPIWQSLRFWNAAFYDALQYERAKRAPRAAKSDDAATLEHDREEQEIITFNLLSNFTSSMRTFGISKDTCLDFIKKQAQEASLSAEKVKILRNNMINWSDKQ